MSDHRKWKFPEKLGFLFDSHRYKVAHGGRGSGKSWSFARALLILASKHKLRVLCAREFQNSITDSVQRLLADQIEELGFGANFKIGRDLIVNTVTGSEFFFMGLRNDPHKVKSTEGIDIAWVEEAEKVSLDSWSMLVPTIRKEGSEIWVTFNPNFASDETAKRFIKCPPPDAKVVEVNWRDNPWFPPVLDKERLHAHATLPESDYLHTWEGKFRPIILGKAVYPEFSHKLHIGQRLAPETAGEIIVGWDNTGLSPAISLSRINPVGQWLIFKEFCFSDVGIMDATEALIRWCNDFLPTGSTYRHIGDPAGNIRDTTKQTPSMYIAERGRDFGWGIYIEDGIQTFKTRRESVANRLTKLVNGEPGVLMDAVGCPLLIEGFGGGYCYPEIGTSGIYRTDPEKNHYSHIHDSVQYPATRLFTMNLNQTSKPFTRSGSWRSV